MACTSGSSKLSHVTTSDQHVCTYAAQALPEWRQQGSLLAQATAGFGKPHLGRVVQQIDPSHPLSATLKIVQAPATYNRPIVQKKLFKPAFLVSTNTLCTVPTIPPSIASYLYTAAAHALTIHVLSALVTICQTTMQTLIHFWSNAASNVSQYDVQSDHHILLCRKSPSLLSSVKPVLSPISVSAFIIPHSLTCSHPVQLVSITLACEYYPSL